MYQNSLRRNIDIGDTFYFNFKQLETEFVMFLVVYDFKYASGPLFKLKSGKPRAETDWVTPEQIKEKYKKCSPLGALIYG